MESPLALWRRKMGLTQTDLGKIARVSQSHISEVEAGVAEIDELLADFLKRMAQRATSAPAKEAEKVLREQAQYIHFVKEREAALISS